MSITDSHTDPPPARHDFLRPYDTFVAAVLAACADAGTQQALRRGLGKPVEEIPARTHAALLRKGLVPDTAKGTKKRAYYGVAALIASRPAPERRAGKTPAPRAPDAPETCAADAPSPAATFHPSGTSLGESLARAISRPGGDRGIKEEGAEGRMHLMVRQETEGLHRMLPGVVRRVGSAGVPIDYARLLYDLGDWYFDRDRVATRWLEDYYRTLRRAEAAPADKNADAPASGAAH